MLDSTIRLRQLNQPEVSGFVVGILNGVLATGTLTGVAPNTGSLTGVFYPISSNPLNYLTPSQTGNFVDLHSLTGNNINLLTEVDTLYYPRSNPTGYLTTGNFNSFVFGTSGIDVLKWVDSAYGFNILYIDAASFRLGAQNSAIQFYNTDENPSTFNPYVSGFDVYAENLTAETINGYSYVPFQSGITGYVPLTKFINGQAGSGFSYFLLSDSIKSTQSLFSAGTGFFLQGRHAINVSNPYIIDFYGSQAAAHSLTSGAPYILGFDIYSNKIQLSGYGVLTVADVINSGLINRTTLTSVSGNLQTSIDRLGTGTFYPLNTNPYGYITTGQTGAFGGGSTPTGNLTGIFYPLSSNPSGYLTSGNTVSFITTSQTGNFATATSLFYTGNTLASWTGNTNNIYYPRNSNPSNFITASQTGIFITTSMTGAFGGGSTPTGNLTGVFYPLTTNPSGYITTSQTGSFVTTGQTGSFSSNTGQLTGTFYPLNTNPSGYLTSGLLPASTGSYIFTTIATSGVTQQFITYPNSLGNNPYVMCNLNNTGGIENILAQPSGITSSGYWAQYSNIIDSSSYILTTLASTTQTGFATTIFLQSGSTVTGTGLYYPLTGNPSGFITTGQTGSFATNTGFLTGAFYPLGSNPSGYIVGTTGLVVPSVHYTTSINWGQSNTFYTTLTGNTNFSFTGALDGQTIIVTVSNTGSNTYSGIWPSGLRWPNTIIPYQSSGNVTDIYTFVCVTGTVYGNVIQGF